jgi:hypothetical protein
VLATVTHGRDREITILASRTRGVLCSTSKSSDGGVGSPSRAWGVWGVCGAAADDIGPVARRHRWPRTDPNPGSEARPRQLERPVVSRLWPRLRPRTRALAARGDRCSPLVCSRGKWPISAKRGLCDCGCSVKYRISGRGDCATSSELVRLRHRKGGTGSNPGPLSHLGPR